MNSVKKEIHVPLHVKLERLESSLSRKISLITRRVTIIENILLKELGAERVLDGHSIISLLKTNFTNFHLQFNSTEGGVDGVEDEDPMDFDVISNHGGDDVDYTPPSDQDEVEELDYPCADEKDPCLNSQPCIFTTRSGRKVRQKFPSSQNTIAPSPVTREKRNGGSGTKETPPDPPVCDHCGATFSNYPNLRIHKSSVHGEKKFKCQKCDESFRTEFKRNFHVKTHHDHTRNRPHQCDICSAAFLTRANLKVHQQVHTGLRLYSCESCNKAWKHRTGYLRHMVSIHEKFRAYSCPKCPKKFFEGNHVRRHLKMVHKISEKMEIPRERQPAPEKLPKPPRPPRIRKYGRVLCEICGSNILKKGYPLHLKTHSTHVNCHICGKGFPTESALKAHQVLAHDPTRAHACSHAGCDAKFKEKTTLRQHWLLKHSMNPREYPCEECGQKYKTGASLTRHINATHTHEKLFSCLICFHIFHTTNHLKRHLVRIHKATGEELEEHGLGNHPNLPEPAGGDLEKPHEEPDSSPILDSDGNLT